MVASSGGAKKPKKKSRKALNSDKAKNPSSKTKPVKCSEPVKSSKSPVKFVVHPQTRNKIPVYDNNNQCNNNNFTQQEIKLPTR